MTPEQRKQEMGRRLDLAKQKRAAAELAEKRARNTESKRKARALKAGQTQAA
jgi:hypothetical protein